MRVSFPFPSPFLWGPQISSRGGGVWGGVGTLVPWASGAPRRRIPNLREAPSENAALPPPRRKYGLRTHVKHHRTRVEANPLATLGTPDMGPRPRAEWPRVKCCVVKAVLVKHGKQLEVGPCAKLALLGALVWWCGNGGATGAERRGPGIRKRNTLVFSCCGSLPIARPRPASHTKPQVWPAGVPGPESRSPAGRKAGS